VPIQTVKFRPWSTAATTAGTSKTVPIPSTWAAGDLAIIHFAGASSPDATPTGWTLWSSRLITSQLYSGIYTKRLVSGDIGTTLTFTITTSPGRSSITGVAIYANQGAAVLLNAVPFVESTVQSTHALTAIQTAGPGEVLTFLALKDTATVASATWNPPSLFGSSGGLASTGTSQVISYGAYNNGGDVGINASYGSGQSWSVLDGTGGTTATSQNAVTWQLFLASTNRPVADVTVAAGATFTGGTTITGVTAGDDVTKNEQYTGTAVTNTVQIAVPAGGPVPSFFWMDFATDVVAASTSIHAYADLGATNYLDLGTYSTLIPTDAAGGVVIYFDLTPLTGTQISAILADAASGTPVGFRLRWVSSVA
jgi:hypothetical protein